MRQLFLFALLVAVLLVGATAAAEAAPLGTFVRGSPTGCFLGQPEGWIPLTVPRHEFTVGTRLKTDTTGWGTLVFPFGSLVLHGDSEVRIEPAGLLLQRGSAKAFVRRSAQGFKFRLPGAMLAVRGTVFAFDADGGLAVEAGAVEATADGSAPVVVGPGQSWGSGVDAGNMPATLAAFEAALRAEHDGQTIPAITAFLDLLADPAVKGLSSFREHLVEKALTNFCRADLPATHPLVARLRAAARELPDGVYAALEATLAREDVAASRRLLDFAELAGADRRALVARALLAEMTLDDPTFERLMKELAAPTPQETPRPTGFWGSSLTFLQAMSDPRLVAPAQITGMVSPSSLERLAPKAAAKRVAIATRLPASTLEAQGLYYLIKALKMDGKLAEAQKLLAFLQANYPGSPWLDRAIRLMAHQEKAAPPTQAPPTTQTTKKVTTDTAKNASGFSTMSAAGSTPPAAAADDSGQTAAPPPAATGKTQTGDSPTSDTPPDTAESLADSF